VCVCVQSADPACQAVCAANSVTALKVMHKQLSRRVLRPAGTETAGLAPARDLLCILQLLQEREAPLDRRFRLRRHRVMIFTP